MGGISIWYWMIVLTILACACIALVAVSIRMVARAARRPAAPVPAPLSGSTEARLLELASLRTRGLITDDEYSDILSSA